MKKMLTRITAMLFVVLMLTSLTAYAAEPSEIRPMYTYIVDLDCEIERNGDRIEAKAVLDGDLDVTKCSIKLTIQKRSGTTWADDTTWNETRASSVLIMEKSVGAVEGYEYRAIAIGKVWVGTTTESGTDYSDIV